MSQPSITNDLYVAICNWLKCPDKKNKEILLEKSRNTEVWCCELYNLVQDGDTEVVCDYCYKNFPAMFWNVKVKKIKTFNVIYSRFIVFEFTTNTTTGKVTMTHKFTHDPPSVRKSVLGPFTTKIYVVQIPINCSEQQQHAILPMMFHGRENDIEFVEKYCQMTDINNEILYNISYKSVLHMVVTNFHYCNEITTYIRPIILESDTNFKADEKQHVMFCKLNSSQINKSFKEVKYFGRIRHVTEYIDLYQMFEKNKVEIKLEAKPEETKPEIKLEAKPEIKLEEAKPIETETDYVVVRDQEKEKQIAELKRQRDLIVAQLANL